MEVRQLIRFLVGTQTRHSHRILLYLITAIMPQILRPTVKPVPSVKRACLMLFGMMPTLAAGLELNADYLLEIASDLSEPNSSLTNIFGLGHLSAKHIVTTGMGERTIRVSAFWLAGESLTNSVNDLNGLSNIAGLEAIRLAHLWYQYETEVSRFKIGRFDVDDDFMAFDSGADLINSSFGAFANVTANMPVPTYPVPGLAALASFRWNTDTYLDITIMDGDAGAESQHDNFGFDFGSSGIGGVFVLTQFNHTLTEWAAGANILLGVGLHSGDFDSFNGQRKVGNGLLYGGIEKQLWSRDNRVLTTAIRIAASSFADRNPVTYQADFTATYRGAFNLNDGMFSFGFVYLDLSNEFSRSDNAKASEWTTELNYRYDFSPHWFVVSSLQFIDGGTVSSGSKLVGLLRFGWSY